MLLSSRFWRCRCRRLHLCCRWRLFHFHSLDGRLLLLLLLLLLPPLLVSACADSIWPFG